LNIFKNVNPEAYNLYRKVKDFYDIHSNSVRLRDSEYMEFAEKVADFQLFCLEHKDESLISEKSRELFKVSDFGPTIGINLDIWESFNKLVEYSEGISIMLNSLSAKYYDNLNDEQIFAIQEYLALKNKVNFKF
jgi:hypothetical protein